MRNFTHLCIICASFLLSFPFQASAQFVDTSLVQSFETLGDGQFGFPIKGYDSLIAVGSPARDGVGLPAQDEVGRVSLYKLQADGTLKFFQNLSASDRDEEDRFGNTIAMDANTIAVGAIADEDGTPTDFRYEQNGGSVYIFEKDQAGNWIETQKIVPTDRNFFDSFGFDLTLYGDQLFIGSTGNGEWNASTSEKKSAGAVYVYTKSQLGRWEFSQKLVASDRELVRFPQFHDVFGASIEVQDSTLFIGAPFDSDGKAGDPKLDLAGSVYLFVKKPNGMWEEKAKLLPGTRAVNQAFGENMSINGDELIIGASSFGDSTTTSAAYIFRRLPSGTWTESQKLTINGLRDWDSFGEQLLLLDSFAIVSAVSERIILSQIGTANEGAGAVYIFRKGANNQYTLYQKIVAPVRSEGALFGGGLSVTSNHLFIGAPRTNSSAGAFYAYPLRRSLVSIDPQLEENSVYFSVFPNPAQSSIQVRFEQPFGKPVTLVVHDYAGKQVLKQVFDPGEELKMSLPIQAGMYVLHMKVEGHKPFSYPFIKQ